MATKRITTQSLCETYRIPLPQQLPRESDINLEQASDFFGVMVSLSGPRQAPQGRGSCDQQPTLVTVEVLVDADSARPRRWGLAPARDAPPRAVDRWCGEGCDPLDEAAATSSSAWRTLVRPCIDPHPVWLTHAAAVDAIVVEAASKILSPY